MNLMHFKYEIKNAAVPYVADNKAMLKKHEMGKESNKSNEQKISTYRKD